MQVLKAVAVLVWCCDFTVEIFLRLYYLLALKTVFNTDRRYDVVPASTYVLVLLLGPSTLMPSIMAVACAGGSSSTRLSVALRLRLA